MYLYCFVLVLELTPPAFPDWVEPITKDSSKTDGDVPLESTPKTRLKAEDKGEKYFSKVTAELKEL